MNKSLEYIKSRIKSNSVTNMFHEEFSNMQVLQFNKEITEKFPYIIYDPDADFDYFTLETCVCDGTMMFLLELVERILVKLINFETCYSPAVENLDQSKIFDIKYIVGDFIINSHIINPPDLNRPWLKDKFTVMLPIKFEVKTFEKQ